MGYRAFLSYSRQDDRTANWLHRALDSYRVPKGLDTAAAVPDRLHPIFRDRTDMAGGGELTARIHQALVESEALIVLCSPAAAASPWVNREVETFDSLGKSDRIFPVIATDLDDAADVEQSFFPAALRGRGLLAADLREIRLPNGKIVGDGKESGRLKLIAGLLGVGLNDLARRERRRQRLLNLVLSTAAAVFAGVAVLAGFQTMAARDSEARPLDALISSFVERANERMEAGDTTYAMALAVAAWRAAPAYERELRPILSRALFEAPPFAEIEGISEDFFNTTSDLPTSPDDFVATFNDDGRRLLITQTRRDLSDEPVHKYAVLVDVGARSVLRGFDEIEIVSFVSGGDAVLVRYEDGRTEVRADDGTVSVGDAASTAAVEAQSARGGDIAAQNEQALAISRDGRMEVRRLGDYEIEVSSVAGASVSIEMAAPVVRAEFADQNRGLIVWTAEGYVRRLDLQTRQSTVELRTPWTPLSVSTASRMALVQVGDQFGFIPFSSSDTARAAGRFDTRAGRAMQLSFSADDTGLLVLSAEGEAVTYDRIGEPGLRVVLCHPDLRAHVGTEHERECDLRPVRAFWLADGGVVTIGNLRSASEEPRYGAAVWDADGARQSEIGLGAPAWYRISAIATSADRSRFALITDHQEDSGIYMNVEIYDSADLNRIAGVPIAEQEIARDLAFARDGGALFIIGDDGARSVSLPAGVDAPFRSAPCLQAPRLRDVRIQQRMPTGHLFCLEPSRFLDFDFGPLFGRAARPEGEFARKPTRADWAVGEFLWSSETPESLFQYADARIHLSSDGRRALVLRQESVSRLRALTRGAYGSGCFIRCPPANAEDAMTHAQIVDFGQDEYFEAEFRSAARLMSGARVITSQGATMRMAAAPSGAFLFDGARAVVGGETGAFIIDSDTGALLATLIREPVDAVAVSSNSSIAALVTVGGEIILLDVSDLAPRPMTELVGEVCEGFLPYFRFDEAGEFEGRDAALAAGFWPIDVLVCENLDYPHEIPVAFNRTWFYQFMAFIMREFFNQETREPTRVPT